MTLSSSCAQLSSFCLSCLSRDIPWLGVSGCGFSSSTWKHGSSHRIGTWERTPPVDDTINQFVPSSTIRPAKFYPVLTGRYFCADPSFLLDLRFPTDPSFSLVDLPHSLAVSKGTTCYLFLEQPTIDLINFCGLFFNCRNRSRHSYSNIYQHSYYSASRTALIANSSSTCEPFRRRTPRTDHRP